MPRRARLAAWLLAAVWLPAIVVASLRAVEPPAAIVPTSFFGRDSPLPDPGGLRAGLADRGISFGLLYTGEITGNPAGGYRQGAVYDGLVTAGLDVDLGKLARLPGLKFHALAYYAHGASGTDKYVRDLNRFSNIDAFDSVRLFELWLETALFGNAINLRAGQVALDAEFATTQGGALFLSSNFGALPVLTLNVPSSIYPQAAPGVRLRLTSPDVRFYLQAGVYAGNPNADRDGDPSPGFRAGGTADNDHGVRFPVSGNQGALTVSEFGFLVNQGPDDRGLPGAYRIGGFYHTGTFSDQRVDDAGRSLADPRSDGQPRGHHGQGGLYVAADQVLYRRPAGTGDVRENVAQTASAPVGNAGDAALTGAGTGFPTGAQLRVFGRGGFALEDDRGPVGFYLEAGLNYRALLPGRGQDVLGVGVTYTDLSGDLRRAVRDANRLRGTRDALPDYEAVLEITYQVNLAPWLSLQPDLQYVMHPSGSPRYGDALVLGTRTVVTF